MRTTTLFGSLAVVFAFGFTSCEPSTTTELPTEVSKQEVAAQSGNVYWSSNKLNFSHNGNNWRIVRDQRLARYLKVYRNGTRVGDIRVIWRDGRVVKRRFIDLDGNWAEFGNQGVLLDTGGGSSAAQSSTASGFSTLGDPNDPDLPCHEIYQEFLEAGDIAIVAGVVSIFTGGATTPIGLVAAGVFVVESTKAIGKMTSWVRCRNDNSNGGGGDGDDHECTPEEHDQGKCDA